MEVGGAVVAVVEAGSAQTSSEGARASDIRHRRGYGYCRREQRRGCSHRRREKGQAALGKVAEGMRLLSWSSATGEGRSPPVGRSAASADWGGSIGGRDGRAPRASVEREKEARGVGEIGSHIC
jgi:hypothetical protein